MWQEVTLVVAVFVTVNASDNQGQCRKPPFVKSAVLLDQYLVQQSFSVGQVVSYKCLPGYNWNESTPNFVVCQANFTWSEPLMSCMPKNCGPPKEIENGYSIVSGQTFGETATYRCNIGYQLLGKSQILCTNRGWSQRFQICEPFLDHETQVSTPTVSIKISTVYERTAQTRSLTTDGAQTNHSFTSLPSSLPYYEDQTFIPSTVATTINTMNETTGHTHSPTIDGARTNHSFTSLPSYSTTYEQNQTDRSMNTSVTAVINKTIPPNKLQIPAGDFEKSLTLSAASNYASHIIRPLWIFLDSTTYEQNQTDRSMNTSVTAVINKTIPPNKLQIPAGNFEKSLTLSAASNYTSHINRPLWIFLGLGFIVVILIAIIPFIWVRRKSGSYSTGS